MALPVATLLPDVIGLSDKDYHSAATFVCDWTVNSAVKVDLSQTAFQGDQLKKKFNRLLINNATSKDIVTVSYLGLSLTVNPYQQQNISLPDKVSVVVISGISGTCRATLSNGEELIGDTLNAYQAQVTAGTNGLFAVNKYTASQSLTAADLNKTIVVSAATPQTLTFQAITANAIANGALLVIENIGAATWTITPNILDNFNEGVAGASITVATGESLFVSCNGANTWYYYRVSNASTTRTLLATINTAATATLSVTGLNPSLYRWYEIEANGLKTNNGSSIFIAASGDNGVNYGTQVQIGLNNSSSIDGVYFIYNILNINIPLQGGPYIRGAYSSSSSPTGTTILTGTQLPKNATGGTGVVNALQFTANLGLFTVGSSIKIYGVL